MIYIEELDENWALKEAINCANQSPCRSKRGVIIWNRTSGVETYGFNEPPPPLICDGSDACKANCAKTAVHAEQAALLHFKPYKYREYEMIHVKTIGGEAVHSLQPSCWQCSKLILAAGIKYMWLYQKEGLVRYTALDFHNKTLINCGLNRHDEICNGEA